MTEGTGGGGATTSSAKYVLKKLRSAILQMTEGQYVGSGEDLSAQYGISRPTLHQVARALEHEQLITVRRGPNGGYYARRPGLGAAVVSVSTYLRAQNAHVWHFVSLARVMHNDVCRLVTLSQDEPGRALLRAEAETFWNGHNEINVDVMLRRDYVLEGILFDLAGNPVVKLFMRSMHHFWYEIVTEKLLEVRPERLGLWMSHRRRLCEALLAREAQIAIGISKSHWDLTSDWLEQAIGPDPERGGARVS